MKSKSRGATRPERSRSPCGERGLKSLRPNTSSLRRQSLPVRGAWVEIADLETPARPACRSLPVRGAWVEMAPVGVRWLRALRSLPVRGAWVEMIARQLVREPLKSLPVRGAWVEIATYLAKRAEFSRRSPCGERGLKCRWSTCRACRKCRSPCGERGLKWQRVGVWQRMGRRSPCGERGLKWLPWLSAGRGQSSLPVRGAWVEIERCAMALRYSAVAPRAGSVG